MKKCLHVHGIMFTGRNSFLPSLFLSVLLCLSYGGLTAGKMPNPIAAVTVSGVVKDDTGQPVPGVNIVEKGTTNGTITDGDGKYTLNVTSDNSILVFTGIGFASQEITVGSQTEINVSLSEDIKSLGEVVVIGYGTTKRADVITSISTVDGSELNMKSTPNFESSLQGLAAGVNVQSSSGSPGAPAKILIRGANSLNLSSDPLYIIDGMPISTSAFGAGSSNLSPMSLINSSDIESVSVLKDAGATAIYGSRASNGVVLVTTKSAKKDDSSIQLNYSSGISSLTHTTDYLGLANTKQWFQTLDAAYLNSPTNPQPFTIGKYYASLPSTSLDAASPQLTQTQADSINTNWYSKLFHTGSFQNINLSASQGSDKSSFYVSGNYYKNVGVQDNVKLERFTIRTNLDFRPSKNLTISPKLTFSYTKNDQRPTAISTIISYALPWLPVYEPNTQPQRYYNAITGTNPVANNDPSNTLNRVEQYRGLGGISLDYKLPAIKGLSLKTSFSGDIQQSNNNTWVSSAINLRNSTVPASMAYQELITSTAVNYNAYIDYNRSFNEHSINVTGGAEATRSLVYSSNVTGYNTVGRYQELGALSGAQVGQVYGKRDYERYLMGFFGRANYKFKDRYFLGLSARRDGSSVFIPKNRWGTFLAASAGWILSEERFMSFLNGNTFLKIRGSYGEIGNQFIPSNLDQALFNSASTITYGGLGIQGSNGTIPVNIAATLKWETTKSSDIGLDFGFFKNRLNGSFAYYHRLVDNMLIKASVPYSAGISSQQNLQNGGGTYDQRSSVWGNYGSMVNSGYEIELHSINYDHNGIKWTTDFNAAFNKQIIKRLTPDIDRSGQGLVNGLGNQVSRTGDRRGQWYLADYAGVSVVDGSAQIYALDTKQYAIDGSTVHLKDGNGNDVLLDATNTNVQNNRFYQNGKSGDPRYQGGITNTVQYKAFDFGFTISFQGGNYILDWDRDQLTRAYPTHQVLGELYDKSWKQPGDIAKYPQVRFDPNLSGQQSYNNSYLYKGDFIRLRNVQLGYRLPSVVLQRLSIKSARIYVSGSNLYTITKYPGLDPETAAVGQRDNNGSPATPGFVQYQNNAIPQLKTLTVGIDIKL